MDVTDHLLATYLSRFVNRADIYFAQWAKGEKYGYTCVKPDDLDYEPVTTELIARHLAGKITVAWPSTNINGMSKWCCWDSDDDRGHLSAIKAVLSNLGFHTLNEGRRPGREGHLWLLFDCPVPAEDLIRFSKEVLAHAAVCTKDVEFFPKSATGLSQVRGPLGIHRKPGANNERGWFEYSPRDITAQLQWLSNQPLAKSVQITRLASALRLTDLQSTVSKPTTCSFGSRSQSTIAILDLIPPGDLRLLGNELVTRCPLCAAEGHDQHRDNLRISRDGQKFCCVYGGPGQVHKCSDIVAILQNCRSSKLKA